jgi:hypothetical protein
MPSSIHPDHGLTVWDASSSEHARSDARGGHRAAADRYRHLVGIPVLRGRITLEEIRRHTGLY